VWRWDKVYGKLLLGVVSLILENCRPDFFVKLQSRSPVRGRFGESILISDLV